MDTLVIDQRYRTCRAYVPSCGQGSVCRSGREVPYPGFPVRDVPLERLITYVDQPPATAKTAMFGESPLGSL